jgi:hypothetical protein
MIADLFPIYAGLSIRAQLLKLSVERLPVGADARIAKIPGCFCAFGHILCKL